MLGIAAVRKIESQSRQVSLLGSVMANPALIAGQPCKLALGESCQ